MKALLFLVALTLSSALAQFGWDDEPSVDPVPGALDSFDHVLRTPAIEPVEPFEPVLRPFRSVLNADEDPLVEQCDLEPRVAQAYRKADIAKNDEDCPEFLGRLSANPYAVDSTANPYSSAGSPYSSKSVNNPYDPDSVSNPYGRYGSPYSSTSINNPYSTYGSPYSSQSPNNPYATQAPLLFGD
jgi:hypothetical protein